MMPGEYLDYSDNDTYDQYIGDAYNYIQMMPMDNDACDQCAYYPR